MLSFQTYQSMKAAGAPFTEEQYDDMSETKALLWLKVHKMRAKAVAAEEMKRKAAEAKAAAAKAANGPPRSLCPQCGESISVYAKKCRFCGGDIPSQE